MVFVSLSLGVKPSNCLSASSGFSVVKKVYSQGGNGGNGENKRQAEIYSAAKFPPDAVGPTLQSVHCFGGPRCVNAKSDPEKIIATLIAAAPINAGDA